jgi:hypothetical protein
MTDNPGGGAGGAALDPVAELARRARDRRLVLLTEHNTIDDLDAIDDERFDRIMALTDEVLDLERAAALAAEAAERRAESHAVYRAVAVLGAGAAVLLLVGTVAGWWSGWAVVLLGLDVLAAAVLGAAHGVARWTGRAVAPVVARSALGVGAGLAALAPDWPPWWLRAVAALAMVAVVGLALTTFAEPTGTAEEG